MKRIEINIWAILAIFSVLPFMMIMPGTSWQSQQIFLLIASVIIVAFAIKNIWVRLFLLYIFGWTLFLFFKVLVENRITMVVPQVAMAMSLFILVGAIIFKFVSESRLPNESFYKVIRIAVILQVVVSITQYLGFYPWDWLISFIIYTAQTTADIGPFIGTLGNRDILACFLAIALPMFLGWEPARVVAWKTKKTAIVLLTLSVIFVLLFSPSPGVLAAFIAVGIYYNRGWKFTSLAVLGACIYGGIYIAYAYSADILALPQQVTGLIASGKVDPNPEATGRLWKWMFAISQLDSWDKIIFGKGLGAFWGKKYPLHNEYVQILFELGLIGLTLMLGYITSTFRFLRRSRNIQGGTPYNLLFASFIAICIDMGANSSMHIATTAFLIIIVAGLIERGRLHLSSRV